MSKARWILVNAAAGMAALVVTGLAGALSSRIPPEGIGQLGIVVAMLLTGAAEGAIVGAMQASVLPKAPRARFIGATAIAFGLAWLAGVSASFLEPTSNPSLATTFAVALIFGASLGALVGWLQARVVPIRGWIGANTLAWSGALVAGAVFADLVPDGPFTLAVLAISGVGGLVSGGIVGALTAPFAAQQT